MNGPPSDSSSTTEAVEKAQDIIEDLSGDDNSTDNGLSDNIQQIAASINGLVGIAKQSQHTQEM